MKKQKKKRKINFAAAHKRLWLWLAENPKAEKHDWPEWLKQKGKMPMVIYFCFACHIGHYFYCPMLDKRCSAGREVGCLDGLFKKWFHATGEKRQKFALKIANLKWHGKKMFEVE